MYSFCRVELNLQITEMYFREIWSPMSSTVAWERKREILCRIFEVWDESLNMRNIEPNKMAEATGGWQRIRKLAKLSVFFEVHRSSFHHHSKGGNNNKKQNKTKQTVSQISNWHFYYCLYGGYVKGGSVDRSVQWSADQVRRGVGFMDWGAVFLGHPRF